MTEHMKIGYTKKTKGTFETLRETQELTDDTDYSEIAAIVIESKEQKIKQKVKDTSFNIPIIEIDKQTLTKDELSQQLETSAKSYIDSMLSPFLTGLISHYRNHPMQFCTPGHQNGAYFLKHPTGRMFYNLLGGGPFENDHSSSDLDLGDLLIHQGLPCEAQKHAAKVYNADKTYFVVNGSSTSNLIVCKALLAENDLVLFDRNNHKSVYNGALVESGAIPIYLETTRNGYGFIGGVDAHCFEESYIRERIRRICPEKANMERPIRLAYLQLGTYDGIIYNAKQVVEKIGRLCDYICFDSAWVGYEQFIPIMKDCSPLLLELSANDPGILVVQSIHKQQAGFSQASQIHKKDSHIKDQKRYVNHKRFNNAFMLYSSTSPFYPLFASIDVNAKIQEGEAGKKLWMDCVKMGIEARKRALKELKYIKPFVPPLVDGKRWEEFSTDEISGDIKFFKIEKNQKWHGFEGIGENQYFIDPCKLIFTTAGIDNETREYENFGIPAKVLANFLMENSVYCEKCDFNSILFLMTPAENKDKLDALIDLLVRFEKLIEENVKMEEALPVVYKQFKQRYEDYSLKELCQEIHDFYRMNNAKEFQRKLFREQFFPEVVMNARKASNELVKNNCELVPLNRIVGRVALEGALPYPPGIFVIVPGEKWNSNTQNYFLILQEGMNNFPGFDPEIQGVYFQNDNGRIQAYGYVWDREKE